jgi:chorismate mutase / prephenate dehydratase
MPKSIPDKQTGDLNTDIEKLRQAIDVIDEDIMDLINQRLLLAVQIGGLKKQGDIQIADKRRETEIMDRLLEKNKGPLDDDGLRNIFSAIIAQGRNVQQRP